MLMNNINKMNICKNTNCNTKLPHHSKYCFKCGYAGNNYIINDLGPPILKRQTHILCHYCNSVIQDYGDKFCRDCGIQLKNISNL